VDLRDVTTVHRMPSTPDPRHFYRVSKVVLLPSLCRESYPRVAVEAILNRLPVLGTRRGGIPEVLDGAGFLFDLPARCTPRSREAPTAAEMEPWLQVIERLWDDPAFLAAEQRRCASVAHRWHPDVLVPQFEGLFLSLLQK
jgi:glycosyltransferase involved in cell wall biosynthesis